MGKNKGGEIVVGLDIGTTKICAIVGELTDDGIDIIGIGTHPSKGLRKGVVVNIEATVHSIRRAIDEAEAMAGTEITHVYTGIAGGHIKGFGGRGVVALKDNEVRDADIARVIEQAKTVNIPVDREVIHVLPQEFIVDDQGGIREPLGMTGVPPRGQGAHRHRRGRLARRTSSSAPTAPGSTSPTSCCSRSPPARPCSPRKRRSWASAWWTSAAAPPTSPSSTNGAIVHTAVIALGGNNLTNDIAVGLRTPMERPSASSRSTAAR